MSKHLYNQDDRYEQLSENEYPSDSSSGNDSGSEDDDPWWHREHNRHQGWWNRSGRQDNQHGRQDDRHGRQDDRHGRQDDQHGRQDDQHGRSDNQHGRQDNQHGRQDNQHGRRDNQHGRQDRRHRRLPMSRITMPTGSRYSITLPISTESDCDDKTKRITLKPHGHIGKREYTIVKKEMENTIRKHPPSLFTVDVFSRYEITKIEKLVNGCLWKRYRNQRWEVKAEAGFANERMLFHGSEKVRGLVLNGFDERHSSMNGLFGAGLYFASNSSKSDQYVFGSTGVSGCPEHGDLRCHHCERQMLLCRVILGKVYEIKTPEAMANPPPGFHSVKGLAGGVLEDPEYIVYRGEQVYAEYLITYKTKE